VNAYLRGDPQKLADFVRKNGVLKGIEANQLADLLINKPDARAGKKAHTQLMLDEVVAWVRHRNAMHGVKAAALEYRERLRARLVRLGWVRAKIETTLRKRFASIEKYKLPTDVDINEQVARNFGLDPKSVKRARLRHKPKKKR